MDRESSFSSVVAATSSNLTRLSEKMASTATVLATPYGDLSQSSAYSQAMSSLTGPQFQKRMFSFRSMRRTPSEVVKESFSRAAMRNRLLATIPDELLVDLPAPKTKFSLYQGFCAQHCEAPSLEAYGIEKELATCELMDIDRRITELQEKRKLVFNKVAAVERQERSVSSQAAQQARLEADETKAAAQGRSKKRRPKVLPTLQQFYSPGDFIRGFRTGNKPVVGVDFDVPFGSLVAATGHNVQVWDLSEKGESPLRASFSSTTSRIGSLRMNDRLIVTGKDSGLVEMWDLERSHQDQVPAAFEGHIGAVTAVDLDADAGSLVSGSQDQTIRHWDMTTGKCVQTLDVLSYSRPSRHFGSQYEDQVKCVGALQHIESAMASGTADGIVRLWDLRASNQYGQQGQVVRELRGHVGPVTCLHFNSMNVVSGSLDGSIRIWDIRMGAVLDAFSYDHPVMALSFDKTKVVTAIHGEPAVRVYDRTKRVNWACAANDDESPVCSIKYEHGYLVEGRLDGAVNTWAC